MNHTVLGQTPSKSELGQQLSQALGPVLSQAVEGHRCPRGRPRLLSQSHLWLSLLLCLFNGMHSYQDWWRWLRSTPCGPFQPVALTDDALVKRLRQAGVALFNIRTQQWQTLRPVRNALAQGAALALPLLEHIPIGSLLLFDLGYFNFAWFDYLGEREVWWVSRWRLDTTYQLVHTFYRQQEVLDALVWLGSKHGSHAGRLCPLVHFGDGKQMRYYVTNVLDPHLLSVHGIAQLYARRWDIELAFLTLKEYLDLHHWWSSHPVLIEQQLWLVLLLAQVYQAWRVRLAVHEHVEVFDVSLSLLIRQGEAIAPWMHRQGKDLGLLRANQRFQVHVPSNALEDYQWPSGPLPSSRLARYQPSKPRARRPSGAYWRRLKREREQQYQHAPPFYS